RSAVETARRAVSTSSRGSERSRIWLRPGWSVTSCHSQPSDLKQIKLRRNLASPSSFETYQEQLRATLPPHKLSVKSKKNQEGYGKGNVVAVLVLGAWRSKSGDRELPDPTRTRQ